MSSDRERLWTPLFCALVVANCGIFVSFYMLTSTLSAWVMPRFHTGQSAAGMVGTAFFLGAVVARLVSGRLLLGLGERATLLGSLAALLVTCLAYPLVASLPALVALRFAHGVAYGIAATGVTGAALSRVPGRRRGEGSGWIGFGMALVTGLGPYLGGVLQRGPGQGAVFTTCIASSAVALLLVLAMARRLSAQRQPREPGLRLADFLEPRAVPIGLVVLLCAVPFGAVLTLVAPYGASVGLTDAAGYYFLLYAAVIVVARPVAGILQDRHGDMSVVLPLLAATVAGLACTALAHHGWLLLLGGALLGLGYGTMVGAGQTVAINRVGAERAGVGLASYFVLVDGGTGIGPYLLGSLVPVLGYRATFLVGVGCALLALVAAVRLRRRTGVATSPHVA